MNRRTKILLVVVSLAVASVLPMLVNAAPDALWDQPGDGRYSYVSQNFTFFAFLFFSADDFSNAIPWNIESIFVDGTSQLSGALPNAASLNWFIYHDAPPGVPGGRPDIGGDVWSHSCLPSDPEVTFSGANSDQVTLNVAQAQGSPLFLPPGKYWLVFYPSLDFSLYGQWYWDTAGTTNLGITHAVDPSDFFGMGWTDWTPWTDLDPLAHDSAFRIEGTGGGLEFSDAPEGALAYPSTGVTGAFPTCKNIGVAGWVQHNNFGTWFGLGFDFESDGNAGLCRQCEYEICLEDSYGDGWNGGTVDVFVNGTPVYTGLTLASGYGPACHPIPVGNGDEITVDYTAGSWSYENEYYIYDSYGVLVRSEGTGGVTPGDVLPGQLYAACPPCFPPYDQDECFQDGDAGLILPQPYTIQGGAVLPCGNSAGTPLGDPCQWAQWGSDIDILIHNWMPGHPEYRPGYVNVLIDWNQDGQWQNDPATTCDGSMVPEHVLVDFVIPPQYDGTLSTLGPPTFQMGPNEGYVWARFSITEVPVGSNWTGEGDFEDGETEDYLLRVYEPPPVGGQAYPVNKASLLAPWIAVAVL